MNEKWEKGLVTTTTMMKRATKTLRNGKWKKEKKKGKRGNACFEVITLAVYERIVLW